MSKDYIPNKDTDFQDWLGNFLTVGQANMTILGLVTVDFTPLSTDKTAYDTAITDAEAKAAAAKSATTKKDNLRKTAESKARALVKRIQAKADVPADLKRQLQITVPGSQPAPPVIPYTPTDLIANVIGSGTYELTWKRNNNTTTTIFIVEALIGNTGEFVQITATTKLKFIHTGNPPGQKITYRVKASRSEVFSAYSNIAVVNDVIPA